MCVCVCVCVFMFVCFMFDDAKDSVSVLQGDRLSASGLLLTVLVKLLGKSN